MVGGYVTLSVVEVVSLADVSSGCVVVVVVVVVVVSSVVGSVVGLVIFGLSVV